MYSIGVANREPAKADVLQGTLDIMILQTLAALGPSHGYAIAGRLEQVSDGRVRLNMGTLYPGLMRLEQRAWIKTEWGLSETNRRVKLYSLTKAGAKQLHVEVANWEQTTALVARFLEAKS